MAANVGFAGISYRWFVGQVPPDQNQTSKNAKWKDAWGERVKIRIPGIHDSCEVTDDNLPWAIVAKPTSHGSYSGGSTGIYGGEWVLGFFLDESNQVPVITHVLEKNAPGEVNNDPKEYQATSSTRYNILFSQVVSITIPCNPNLRAGDVIK